MEEDAQKIIKLRFFEELTLEEIARVLEMNVNTVKAKLYRGLKALKTAEGEDGIQVIVNLKSFFFIGLFHPFAFLCEDLPLSFIVKDNTLMQHDPVKPCFERRFFCNFYPSAFVCNSRRREEEAWNGQFP